MIQSAAVRANVDGISDQVGCVRDALAQLESCYRDIDDGIKELCTKHWEGAGSKVLLDQFEQDRLEVQENLRAFRQFYNESLTWVVPQYSVLEASISDAVNALVNGS